MCVCVCVCVCVCAIACLCTLQKDRKQCNCECNLYNKSINLLVADFVCYTKHLLCYLWFYNRAIVCAVNRCPLAVYRVFLLFSTKSMF